MLLMWTRGKSSSIEPNAKNNGEIELLLEWELMNRNDALFRLNANGKEINTNEALWLKRWMIFSLIKLFLFERQRN